MTQATAAPATANEAAAEAAPAPPWNPPFRGEIDMRIARDGTWFYNGSPIGRPALVKLFAGVLRRDPERYVLVTPVECAGEDSVFVSRIREDMTIENGLNMWLVTDNLRKGAALNAVQIAEVMVKEYLR